MARFGAAFAGALVLTLISAAAHAQSYVAPKTPWGDPDLQGIWSGDSAFGIPIQRPESFGTRAELNDKEYADKVARDERARKNALTAVGSFRNDNGQEDPNITSLFDFINSVGLSEQFTPGLLPTDRLHIVNFYGSYMINEGWANGFRLAFVHLPWSEGMTAEVRVVDERRAFGLLTGPALVGA